VAAILKTLSVLFVAENCKGFICYILTLGKLLLKADSACNDVSQIMDAGVGWAA